ncbi:MAG: hypothetical protein J7K83_00650 [Candidatus Aenigmarchaeota archaeon]|nr:hypothetical protein [Candidatus Aenigmarchaeota archaeon]
MSEQNSSYQMIPVKPATKKLLDKAKVEYIKIIERPNATYDELLRFLCDIFLTSRGDDNE